MPSDQEDAPDQTILVSIPDVGHLQESGLAESAPGTSPVLEDPEETLSKASEQRLAEIGNSVLACAEQMVISDLPEKASDWTEENQPNESGRSTDKTKKPTTQDADIDRFVDSILDRFSDTPPVLLLFVGTESNPHTDETCARVCSVLADRSVGRILLLDSDLEGQALSRAFEKTGAPGISEIVKHKAPWKSAICESSNGLDFLPCGVHFLEHLEDNSSLLESVSEMKSEYQFICVSAGDAHSPSAKIWNDICDGSYLLVSLRNSNESIAKSAVAELQSSGARLLGCVVTDIE